MRFYTATVIRDICPLLACPLDPEERPKSGHSEIVLCHKLPFAPQQTAALFDDFVGAAQHGCRDMGIVRTVLKPVHCKTMRLPTLNLVSPAIVNRTVTPRRQAERGTENPRVSHRGRD